MNTKSILISLAIGLLAVALAIAAESASVLLQKGIYTEETEGNLEAAIQIYQQIIAEAEANRSLVAQAQYRLGVCYQKKGNKEQAVAALRQLNTTFPNEGTLNEKAKALLRDLGYAPSENVVIRKLPLPGECPISISRDGKLIACLQNKHDVAVWDLASGQSRTVIKGNETEATWATWDSALFSPDGRQIAYAWDGATNLYLTSSERPSPKRIYHAEAGRYVWPQDWSTDGRLLVVQIAEPTKGQGLGLLTIESGALNEVVAVSRAERIVFACLSANGDLLAYKRISTNEANAGVWVLQLSTGNQTKVRGSEKDGFLGWVPGTTDLLFLSDRTGLTGVWRLEFAVGKPAGDPELVKANIGNIIPLRIANDGAIYYIESVSEMDIYLATVDFERCKLVSPPKRAVDRFPGLLCQPVWSHDGQKLGFVRMKPDRTIVPDTFTVLTPNTGERKDYSFAGRFPNRIWELDWSSEGHFLLVQATDPNFLCGLHRFDFESGRSEPLLTRNNTVNSSGDWYSNPRISPDSKFFYYGRRKFTQSGGQWGSSDAVYRRNLATGQDELVYQPAEDVNLWGSPCGVSPDGKELAIVAGERGEQSSEQSRTWSIKLVPLDEGKVRTLVTMPPQVHLSGALWTPEGKRIVFLKAPTEKTSEIWSIASAGGEPTRIDLQLAHMSRFSLCPDGRQIALETQTQRNTPQLWVMENLFPPVATK